MNVTNLQIAQITASLDEMNAIIVNGPGHSGGSDQRYTDARLILNPPPPALEIKPGHYYRNNSNNKTYHAITTLRTDIFGEITMAESPDSSDLIPIPKTINTATYIEITRAEWLASLP